MNILFVGDIVGRPGRKLLKDHLSSVQEEHNVDYTIVNVENAAYPEGVCAEASALSAMVLAGGTLFGPRGNGASRPSPPISFWCST